jgi:hypothetical protein
LGALAVKFIRQFEAGGTTGEVRDLHRRDDDGTPAVPVSHE